LKIKITRSQILSRIRENINEGKPIIGAGCSAGIIAKCAEMGGADLIVVYSTGKSRLMGLPTSRLGNSNAVTLGMCQELSNVITNTPIIAGVEADDPTILDIELMLDQFVRVGYSGIINFPTICSYEGRYRDTRDGIGMGFFRELEMVKIARAMDIFTIAYVFLPDDAKAMAKMGVDCVCAHVGGTKGGLVGFKNILSLDEAAKKTQSIVEAAQSVNPDIICLSHGGPIETPEETKYIYEHTDVVGYIGASSIERIPVEKAIIETVSQFKNISVKKHRS
jgi:predicted TIM-barrel enzyme